MVVPDLTREQGGFANSFWEKKQFVVGVLFLVPTAFVHYSTF
jgi:hypothetical protein